MEFIQDEIKLKNATINILEYSDFDPSKYLDQLTDIERERFYTFNSLNRKLEFVATRILRHRVFGHRHIHYSTNGAPYIEEEGFISISHSKNIIGIALNHHFQIGFDIEHIRPSIQTIKHKFINKKEESHFDCSDNKTLTQIWSAKETMYKLSKKKELDFKKNIIISKEENQYYGKIIYNEQSISTEICIFEYNGKIITINNSPCE